MPRTVEIVTAAAAVAAAIAAALRYLLTRGKKTRRPTNHKYIPACYSQPPSRETEK